MSVGGYDSTRSSISSSGSGSVSENSSVSSQSSSKGTRSNTATKPQLLTKSDLTPLVMAMDRKSTSNTDAYATTRSIAFTLMKDSSAGAIDKQRDAIKGLKGSTQAIVIRQLTKYCPLAAANLDPARQVQIRKLNDQGFR